METAILFASEGANVLLVDFNLEPVSKVATFINQRYPNVKAIPHAADFGKEVEVKDTFDKAVKEFGRLDVVVSTQA
jgi:NAD(P)-dependent dehydrogenase (short-subunit alcohol dehydrogenase family)